MWELHCCHCCYKLNKKYHIERGRTYSWTDFKWSRTAMVCCSVILKLNCTYLIVFFFMQYGKTTLILQFSVDKCSIIRYTILYKEVMCLNYYTVKQIANMLKTNEETVRRWIRSGKLDATLVSKKGGNIITSDAFNKFIKQTPKYAHMLSSSFANSPFAFSAVVGGLLGGVFAFLDDKKNKTISANDIEAFLRLKIASHEKQLIKKTTQLEKLQDEIEDEKQNFEKYKYALEHLDLELIATEINNEREENINE